MLSFQVAEKGADMVGMGTIVAPGSTMLNKPNIVCKAQEASPYLTFVT